MTNFLICLTGLPASGKSTFARMLKENIRDKSQFKVKIVDPDVIRNKLCGNEFNPQVEPLVREKHLELVKKHLKQGYVVVSDDLNYYTSMRHDLKEIASDLDLPFFLIYVSTPLNECLKWNQIRGKPIPNDLIRDVDQKFDSFNKYKWETPLAAYDLSKIADLEQEVSDLIHLLSKILKQKKRAKKKPKHTDSTDLTYREMVDSVTRKIVGKILEKEEFRNIKEEILDQRKVFLKEYLEKPMDLREIELKFKKFLAKTLKVGDI